MERELGRPVVTSNQAIAWHCLRKGGIEDKVPGFGALLWKH
jgi:maleate isomerase